MIIKIINRIACFFGSHDWSDGPGNNCVDCGKVDTMFARDYCPGGCGWDFAEFPEMRHTEEECGGPECTCYELIGGHQMGCPQYKY